MNNFARRRLRRRGAMPRLLAFALALLALPMLFSPLMIYAEGSSDSAAQSEAPANSGADSDADSAASGDAGEEQDAEPPPPPGCLFAPEDFVPEAEAVCLVNEDTGLTVYQQNADTPLVAASLVKMMTCMLTMDFAERYGKDLDTTLITSDKGWIYDELYGKNASTADIRRGETLSLRELLYAALLPSANEAALLLADYVGGGYMANFMYQMNTRAKALGCTNTVFDDPNGLSEQNLTTAADMAKIARAFMSYPELVEIAATPSYLMAAHEQHSAEYNIFNTNRLIVGTSPYYNAFPASAGTIRAGKTGSLGEWQNFASQAVKNGETYTCVVLHSPNRADLVGAKIEPAQSRPALYESARLYAWAFENLTVKSALDTSLPVTELRVKYSTQQDTVLLMPSGDIRAVLRKTDGEEALRRSYSLPKEVAAPVQAGAVMGSVTLSVAGVDIGSAQLIAREDVTLNPTLYLFTRLGEALSSLYFRAVLVLVLVVAGLYAGALALAANARARQRRAPEAGPPAKPPPGKASSAKTRPSARQRGPGAPRKKGPPK